MQLCLYIETSLICHLIHLCNLLCSFFESHDKEAHLLISALLEVK